MMSYFLEFCLEPPKKGLEDYVPFQTGDFEVPR